MKYLYLKYFGIVLLLSSFAICHRVLPRQVSRYHETKREAPVNHKEASFVAFHDKESPTSTGKDQGITMALMIMAMMSLFTERTVNS